MRLRPAIRCLFILGAGAVFAAEGGAPLEQTKQELQKLRREQKAGSEPAATEGLKSALPGIASPVDSGLPFQMMSPEALREQEKKKNEASKNWLVEGMAKLEREAQRKGRLSGGKEAKAEDDLPEEGAPDSTDPAFLLKTYERNKARQDELAAKKSGNLRPGAKRTDPLAPFMREWLANSPVQSQIMQSLGGKAETASDANRDTTFDLGLPADQQSGPRQPTASGLAAAGAAKSNPYLADLGSAQPSEPRPGVIAPTTGAGPGVTLPGGTAAAPALQPLPEAPPASKKPLPPALSEDKKYFPQLKKF